MPVIGAAPRLLVLGGGSSQLSALRRAAELGFEVVLADQSADTPGRRWAHRFEQASTFDVDAVEASARRCGAAAILAVGSDQPVYTAAAVSRRLGLPYPLSVEQARGVTHKGEMKRVLCAAGIPVVPWALVGRDPARWDDEGLGALRPPWVVKPPDSQGQRGIRIVRSREELRDHLPTALSFSRDTRVLVEEYYPSREVTVSGWAHGEAHDRGTGPDDPMSIWTVTDRVTFDPAISLGVCLAHRFPSEAAQGLLPDIEAITARIVRAFGLRDVPIYFQMLIGADGVLVNEIACRLGGAYEDQSIPLVTGIDILATQLAWFMRALSGTTAADAPQALLGTEQPAHPPDASSDAPPQVSRVPPVSASVPTSRFFSVPLIFARPGVVTRLVGAEQVRRQPGVADCRFLLPTGTRIEAMTNSTQRIAYAVLHGKDATSVNRLVNTLFDTLRVENNRGENLLIDTREETILHSGVR